MFIDDFFIQFNQKNIFRMLQCYENNEVYDVFLEEYQKVEKIAYSKINGKAVLKFGEIPKEYIATSLIKQEGLYVLLTVGDAISTYATALFEEDKYVQGMIVDMMADDYLFQMDQQLKVKIKELCIEKKVYTSKRLEAPTTIPIEIQKVAYDKCDAEKILGIHMKESYMFEPIKTLCVVYELKEGEGEFKLEHECRKCNNFDCATRDFEKVEIKILINNEMMSAIYYGGESLLDFLMKQEIYLPAVCGGRGTCGKCKIHCIEGDLERTEEDNAYFSKVELDQGYRLSCKAYPYNDCTIEIEDYEDSMHIIAGNSSEKKEDLKSGEMSGEFGIAIDIGTTTIAMALVSLDHNKVVEYYTGINHQRVFGADVISRILASNEGKNIELQKLILKDLFEGISKLTDSFSLNLKQVVISGNTTMVHLLMNYSCKKLGEYPYTPENIRTIFFTGSELFHKELDFEIVIMPGISAFVGGDIVSGLFYLDYGVEEEISLFLDLGTNGELVIGNCNKTICTSTAAGPAFEGGKLSSGVASIAGAISKIEIKEEVKIQTIYDKPPIGICGTGIIDGVAEFIKHKIVDETGLFIDPFFLEGYKIAKDSHGKDIKITQKDIREIQLAKAAVAAGIETIIEEFGVSEEEIKKVYIAGGFGYQLDVLKAKTVGILPKNLTGEIELVGNTSLRGGIKLIKLKKEIQELELTKIEKMVDDMKEFHMGEHGQFEKKYMEQMYF